MQLGAADRHDRVRYVFDRAVLLELREVYDLSKTPDTNGPFLQVCNRRLPSVSLFSVIPI